MKTEFYAKTDQTYQEHIEAVYRAWGDLLEERMDLLRRLSAQFGFDLERFLKGSLLSVALHDIGKMSIAFQEMLHAKRSGQNRVSAECYPHELLSFECVARAWELLNAQTPLAHVPLEPLAVAAHHRPIDSDLSSFEKESDSPSLAVSRSGWEQALSLAADLFRRRGWELPHIEPDASFPDPRLSLRRLVTIEGSLRELLQRDDPVRVRILYVLLKGILQHADWHASGKAVRYCPFHGGEREVVAEIEAACQTQGRRFRGLFAFQKALADTSGNALAIAPTGSGKTEAALMWAIRNARELGCARIIYLVPTLASANALWERFASILGGERVALSQSAADVLSLGPEEECEADQWEARRDILLPGAFARPVTVATLDQFLMSGSNRGQWAMKELNIANSAVVLDEVHAYDPWTLGLIVASIRRFSQLGTRFLVVSANLPKNLVEILSRELRTDALVREESLLSACRSAWHVCDSELREGAEIIRTAVSQGRKVLVVANSVPQCQKLVRLLAPLKPACYHSRFILRDRRKIEQLLPGAALVIATQSLEASLELDFDWLLTECAPPDALALRAGRVNRYRDPNRDSKVFLFRPAGKSNTVYNPVNAPWLLDRCHAAFASAPSALTEGQLAEIVDSVYAGYDLEGDDDFRDALTRHHRCQRNNLMVLDNVRDDEEVSRRGRYEFLDAIPSCFRDEVLSLPPKRRLDYTIKLPLAFVLRRRTDEHGITFCDVEYDPDLGAMLPGEKDEPRMVL